MVRTGVVAKFSWGSPRTLTKSKSFDGMQRIDNQTKHVLGTYRSIFLTFSTCLVVFMLWSRGAAIHTNVDGICTYTLQRLHFLTLNIYRMVRANQRTFFLTKVMYFEDRKNFQKHSYSILHQSCGMKWLQGHSGRPWWTYVILKRVLAESGLMLF